MPPPTDNSARRFIRIMVWSVALAGAVVGLTASAFLVNKHFGGSLPGCGPASACDALERSAWSRLPLFGQLWPVSFLGLAHFAGMTAGWLLSFRRVGLTLGVLASVGLLNSLLFTGVMLYLHKPCLFCIITHAANLVFTVAAWSTIALAPSPPPGKDRSPMTVTRFSTLAHRIGHGFTRLGPVAFAVVFITTSLVLAGSNAAYEARRAADAEAERLESLKQITAAAGAAESGGAAIEQPADRWGSAGFTGRYRKGPESAAIRVVVITDFQCPDCKRVEGEILEAMNGPGGGDISLSIKHFPMCKDCNTYVSQTMHGNACFAARAAEAAGILGGDDAFFAFAEWLFEVDGKFETKEALAKGVERAGITAGVDAFAALMQGAEPLKRVRADVEDAMALGLYYTPMVFINGVEMKGWQIPGSVKKTIEQVAATKPARRTASADHPPLAAQRYVDDWKEQPARRLPDDAAAWTTGAPADYTPAGGTKNARLVEVVVFGDYSEPSTARFHSQLREAMSNRPNVRYTFRHYPLNPECNPALPPNVNVQIIRPASCLASRAVEAAGAVGGNQAYWSMHDWVMTHQSSLTNEELTKAAESFQLDSKAFAAAVAAPSTLSAIRDDALGGQLAGLANLPTVFVNSKLVPRPLRDGDNVIRRIIEEAAKDPAP